MKLSLCYYPDSYLYIYIYLCITQHLDNLELKLLHYYLCSFSSLNLLVFTIYMYIFFRISGTSCFSLYFISCCRLFPLAFLLGQMFFILFTTIFTCSYFMPSTGFFLCYNVVCYIFMYLIQVNHLFF